MGLEKPENPEKQVNLVKSLEKSHENLTLTKVMKVVMKKKSTVSAVF